MRNLTFLFIGILATVVLSFLFIQRSKEISLISPVFGMSKLKLANNIWLPKETGEAFPDLPYLTAEAAFFVDTHSGQVLYSKNAHQKLPIASLTKIMTVIVTLQNKKFDDSMTVSNQAANMEPDKMELIAGEKLSVEDLIDGIFTVSANDAAETLADGTTGNRDEFISLMNKKAKEIGMNDSLFINPTGLQEDNKQQYSTAWDVALMSRFLTHYYPHVVDISSQPHIYLPVANTHQDYDLYSGINLLTTYPGVVGLKTGYTPEAGLTLVTLARKGGKEVLGVILGATDRRDDARELLDYSFKKLGI